MWTNPELTWMGNTVRSKMKEVPPLVHVLVMCPVVFHLGISIKNRRKIKVDLDVGVQSSAMFGLLHFMEDGEQIP